MAQSRVQGTRGGKGRNEGEDERGSLITLVVVAVVVTAASLYPFQF
jgi:hypothetical protein